MEISLFCPKCKHKLQRMSDVFYCENCESSYPIRDGYVDFINQDFYAGEFSRAELDALLSDIDSEGFDSALQKFFLKYPHLRDYMLNDSRADWQCHCVARSYTVCLDIGSGLGNISEILSKNFDMVYSLEAVRERIEFQKRRYEDSKIKNIVLLRANGLELPFPDNFFDLVVCNGVLEWVAELNVNVAPREAQISFLSEVKRVLSPRGCAYIGIENRFGFPFILGAVDHSGLRYTSLMPRWMASAIVKRHGRAGGIYGDTSNQKEKRGYVTYTYGLSGYRKLFNEVGFKIKSYWVIPSYNEPRISGRTEDSTALKGYFKYFMGTTSKFRIAVSMLNKFDKSFLSAIVRLLAPSFLFYCYKDEIPECFDDITMSKTQLSSFVRVSTGMGVMYILYDNRSNASKVVHLERPKYRPRDEIPYRDKSKPTELDFHEDVWMETWIEGQQLNPLKFNDSQLAIKWLFDFQKRSYSTVFTKDEIISRVDGVRYMLSLILEMKMDNYTDVFDSYESYLSNINIKKTREHGDFFHGNIIIDKSTTSIHVIDWEYSRDCGDPFFDLLLYVLGALLLPTNTTQNFKDSFRVNGQFRNVLKDLKPMIDRHYGLKINLDKLLPFTLARFFVRKYTERGKLDAAVIQYKQLLDIILSGKFKLNL